MEFYEVIHARESIRNYDPGRPVEKDTLDRIMDAGRIAPSAANRQPWEFWLISSPEMLAAVRTCYHHDWYKNAPHVLVVVGKKDEAWVRRADGHNAIETDLAIAMTHLILAAENEGVGTCWIANFDPKVMQNALGLKEDQVVFGITPLGYPQQGFIKKGEKNRKSFQEVIKYL